AIEASIGVKATFEREADRLIDAIAEMQRAGIGQDCTMTVVRGPDEYLYGEEKALLEVIEGRDPLPRLFPPYEHGLFATAPQSGWEAHEQEPGHTGAHQSNPTLVNNVETLANVPHVLARGAEWFRSMGTDESAGHVLVTVVGDVARSGVAEVELGTPLRDVIDEVGGGTRAGRQVKAVLSGIANPVVTGRGTVRDVDTIGARLKTVTDGNRCYLPVQEQAVVSSLLRSFPEEFTEHLEGRLCPRPGRVVVPKLLDIVDGTARYDERHADKRPDWTYSG